MPKFLPKSTGVYIFGFTSFPFFPRALYFGNEAYDRHQLTSYAVEIIKLREGKKQPNLEIEERLLFDLIALTDFTNLIELGSTLGALLDKFDLYDSEKSANLNYTGIEPLPILARFSEYLHTNRNFKVVDSFTKLSSSGREINYGSMSHTYAFQETEELIDYVDSFRISIDRLYFSLDNRHFHYKGFGGKNASVFNFELFLEKVSKKKAVFLLDHRIRDIPTASKVIEIKLISIDSVLIDVIKELKNNKNLFLLPTNISIDQLAEIKKGNRPVLFNDGNLITKLYKALKIFIKLNMTS